MILNQVETDFSSLFKFFLAYLIIFQSFAALSTLKINKSSNMEKICQKMKKISFHLALKPQFCHGTLLKPGFWVLPDPSLILIHTYDEGSEID